MSTQTFFEGDDIQIEEMPQGCVITQTKKDGSVSMIVVASKNDVEMLRKSLFRLSVAMDIRNDK